jgi:hypothetical protein
MPRNQGHKVNPDPMEPLVRRDQKAHRDRKAQKGQKVREAQKANQDQKARQARKATPDPRDPKVNPVRKDATAR